MIGTGLLKTRVALFLPIREVASIRAIINTMSPAIPMTQLIFRGTILCTFYRIDMIPAPLCQEAHDKPNE